MASSATKGDKTRAKMRLRPELEKMKKGKRGDSIGGTLGAGVTALGSLAGDPPGSQLPEKMGAVIRKSQGTAATSHLKTKGSRGMNDWKD